MGVIGVILMVAFIIVCILLVCIVLVQNSEGGGLGGLLGSGSSAAFGSRSGNVLTRTTYILVALFFLSSFGLALLNKSNEVKPLVPETADSAAGEYWLDAAEPADTAEAAEGELPVAEAEEAQAGGDTEAL